MDSIEAENFRLRRALLSMCTERKKMASKLTGVQNLGLQLQKKELEVKALLEKNERLEGSLARAENRITQLSLLTRNGPQALSSQGAIVTPGVSKRVLEALTRENTKLKQALNHLTNKGPIGVDLAVENRELHEIIMTLRDERDMKVNEVKELQKMLSAVENDNTEALRNQVLTLTAQVTKQERNLNAKQVFCETIVTENEAIKAELQSLKDDRILKVRDMKKELGDLIRTQPEVREIMNQVYDNQDGEVQESAPSEEVNKLAEDRQKLLEELQTTKEENDRLQDELNKSLEELTNYKDIIEIHNVQQLSHQEELERRNQQLHELQHKTEVLARRLDEKEKQLNEQQEEVKLMQDALTGYENDFKMERGEKQKALLDLEKMSRGRDHVIQSYEQLKKEHIGLRQNIERMYSQAQAQQQQSQAVYKRQTSGRSCTKQMQQQQSHVLRPRPYGLEACADGPGDDFTDSPILPPKETTPPNRLLYLPNQGSQLQCPNCRKLFPHDLLENHMRDCTGDD